MTAVEKHEDPSGIAYARKLLFEWEVMRQVGHRTSYEREREGVDKMRN